MASSPDPGNSLVPGEAELQKAVHLLTSTEKEIINDVLVRDEEIRTLEKDRLRGLKKELDEIKEQGVPDGEENQHGRICIRCRTPLGLLTNRGDLCPWCRKKVCTNCQMPTEKSWLCTLCHKEREIKGESGEWFYGSLPKKKKFQYGSTLLKKMIKRRKSQAYKLSKSRHKSEDESFEIEYAIAETFGHDYDQDHDYVVVDRESDGNISVSEGNVASIRHFGSEAAALSSVSEDHENEAPLNDVAFTGPSFAAVDSDGREAEATYVEDSQGTKAGVHSSRRSADNGNEPKARLVALANPFLDEDECSDGEAKTNDENAKTSAENLSTALAQNEPQIPEKPARGVKKRTGDLSTEEEAFHVGESDRMKSSGTAASEDQETHDLRVNSETLEGSCESRGESSFVVLSSEPTSPIGSGEWSTHEAGSPTEEDESKEVVKTDTLQNDEQIQRSSSPSDAFGDENEKSKSSFNHISSAEGVEELPRILVEEVYNDPRAPSHEPADHTEELNEGTKEGFSSSEDLKGDEDGSAISLGVDICARYDPLDAGDALGAEKDIDSLDEDASLDSYSGLKVYGATSPQGTTEVAQADDEGFRLRGNVLRIAEDEGETELVNAGEIISLDVCGEAREKVSEVISDDSMEAECNVHHDCEAGIENLEEGPVSVKERIAILLDEESKSRTEATHNFLLSQSTREESPDLGISLNENAIREEESSPVTEVDDLRNGSEGEDEEIITKEDRTDVDVDVSSKTDVQSPTEFQTNDRSGSDEEEYYAVHGQEKEDDFPDKDSVRYERGADNVSCGEESVLSQKKWDGDKVSCGEESVLSQKKWDGDKVSCGEESVLSQKEGDDFEGNKCEGSVDEKGEIMNERESMDDDSCYVTKSAIAFPEKRSDSNASAVNRTDDDLSGTFGAIEEQGDDQQVSQKDFFNLKESGNDLSEIGSRQPVDIVSIPPAREAEVSFHPEMTIENGNIDHEDVFDDEGLTTKVTMEAGAAEATTLEDQIKSESYLSINSFQSDADLYDTIRPELKIAGQVMLGLKYDHVSGQLEVQVHKATDLFAVDTKKNTSDPYVKTYLQEKDVRSNKKKTKVKKQTLNPVFDEILVYKIDYEQLLEKTLAVSVWHNDMFGQNVFLGEAQIVIASYIDSGYSLDDPTPHQYPLAEKRLDRKNMKEVGDVVLEMKFVPPGNKAKSDSKGDPVSGQLMVRCVEGKNLSGSQESNPFCELKLISVNKAGKVPSHSTNVEAKTVNPYWDQEIVFDNVAFSQLSNTVLEIRVLDAYVGKKPKFLGAVRLGTGASDAPFDDPSTKECTFWQKMMQEPNKSSTATLPLRSTAASLKSSASLPPVLVERGEDMKFQVRAKKSDSILSQASTSSFNEDASSLRGTLSRVKLKPQPDQFSLQSFGSMLSIYSDAGGYGSVPISGEMLFSIKYDNIAGVFEVHVQRAKNIAAVNKKTRASDPYVKTYLLPDKSKDSKKKTAFKRKTVNPDWNEKIKYKIGENDLMKRTLQVSIWNHEKFGQNDFLGEAQVQIQQYVKTGHNLNEHEPIWYTLQESAPVSVGQSVYKGCVTVGLKFDRIDDTVGKLLVDIKDAQDLAAADPTHLSNPFIKSYLLPDRSRKSKRKSTFKKGTLNPTWNEKLEYNGVTLEELEHRVLELTVWDHDLHTNDFLGGARLGLERGDENWHDCAEKEVSIWNAMLEHPGIWVEYSIPLRDSMTSRKGLNIKIPEARLDVTEVSLPVGSEDLNISGPIFKTGNNIDSKIVVDPMLPLVRVGLMLATDSTEDKKKKSNLKVMIRGARNLPPCYNGESPSTYCKCQIKPRRLSWRFKTDLFKRSTEPSWESLFEFEDVDELSTKCAEIVICDEQNAEIGSVRLGSGLMQESWDDSTGREKEIWLAATENPDEWNHLMVPLRTAKIKESSTAEAVKPGPVPTVEVSEPVQPAETPKEKELSAKELALQAMGTHATSVRAIMQKNSVEEESKLKSRNQSQDNLSRTLSLIREEDDGKEQSRVKFAEDDHKGTSSAIPRVVVSSDNAVEIRDEDVDINAGPEMPTNLKKMSKFGSRESVTSMTSVYSTLSNAVTGSVPVRGSIQIGMTYDRTVNTFHVHVFRASNIAAVDVRKEVSDPYVKAYLLPDKSKASKRKTNARVKTINPEWNEVIEYRFSLPELRSKTLMVSVWNHDRLKRNVFLGEVLFPLGEKIDQGFLDEPNSEWYNLEEMRHLNSSIVYKGLLTVALTFEDVILSSKDVKEKKEKNDKKKEKKDKKKKKKEKGRIIIHVVKAVDLPAGDDNGLCDPYCKLYLLPLRQSKTKRKTAVIRRTRDAYWDYQTEYDVDFDDLPDLGIEFLVYDWDKSSRNDFLGCARLNLGGRNGKWDDAVGIEKEAWQKLISEPNVKHEYEIPLRSSTDPRPAEEF